jgi:hypothetical protein
LTFAMVNPLALPRHASRGVGAAGCGLIAAGCYDDKKCAAAGKAAKNGLRTIV